MAFDKMKSYVFVGVFMFENQHRMTGSDTYVKLFDQLALCGTLGRFIFFKLSGTKDVTL